MAFHSYMLGCLLGPPDGSLKDLARFEAISSNNSGSLTAISPI